tara:strand:- start:2132 stop:2446 length:315 start_codon:yes stop_codon:yes gene_type:complete
MERSDEVTHTVEEAEVGEGEAGVGEGEGERGPSRNEIHKNIQNNTFLDLLMSDVKIESQRDSVTHKTRMYLQFPEWYYTKIAKESRNQIEQLIRENAKRLLSEK